MDLVSCLWRQTVNSEEKNGKQKLKATLTTAYLKRKPGFKKPARVKAFHFYYSTSSIPLSDAIINFQWLSYTIDVVLY